MASDAEMADLRGRLQMMESEIVMTNSQMTQLQTEFAVTTISIDNLLNQRQEVEAHWNPQVEVGIVTTNTQLDQRTPALTTNLQQVGAG